jgi:hypothetical protein
VTGLQHKINLIDLQLIAKKYRKTGSINHRRTKVSSKPDFVDRTLQKSKEIVMKLDFIVNHSTQ